MGMAQAEVPTSTKALAMPPRNLNASHSGGQSAKPMESVVTPTPTRPQRIKPSPPRTGSILRCGPLQRLSVDCSGALKLRAQVLLREQQEVAASLVAPDRRND